jgi:hypothetical protein
LVVDETQQGIGHLQVMDLGACSHENLWGLVKKSGLAACKAVKLQIGQSEKALYSKFRHR